MSCFDNIIAVRGTCSDATPSSGIYLNEVVSLSELNDIVTKDYANGEDLAAKKIKLATELITANIYNEFASKFRANSLLEGHRLGYYQDNMQVIAGAATSMRGINIDLCNTSSFLDVYVSSLSLHVNFSGAVNVLVYDLLQNKLLDTIAVTAIANQVVEVVVNKTYSSNRKKLDLIFVYDTSTVNSYKSTLLGRGNCSNCNGGKYSNAYVNARAVKIPSASAKIKSNVTTITDTAGISIIYSVQCNQRDWLCTFSNMLAIPILYKTGAELMEFALLNSDRTNSKTMDPEKLETRRNLYESKYAQAMDNLIKNIKLPTDDKCFQCNQRSRHAVILP